MIVAVTGGTGFIGRQLVVRHLARGDEVRVLSRHTADESGLPESVKWYCGDLCRQQDLLPFVDQADVLYHCAGELGDTVRMEALHVEGTRRLIAAATGKIGRWVQLSSVGVYGKPRYGVVTEQSMLCPEGVYEATKKRSDDLVQHAGMGGAFEWAILRPSIVFGEGMPNQSLFQMIRVVDQGHFFFIGKTGASANYIHVDNVVHALSACALLPQSAGKIFNLSDYVTLESFVEMIAQALGLKSPHSRLPEFIARAISGAGTTFTTRFPLSQSRIDAMTTRVIYSIDAIQNTLNYHHEIDMENGVARLVEAWKATRKNGG